MSRHRPPPLPSPPPPPSSLFGFANFDISGFDDIAAPQMGADGHSSDFMALLDQTMLGTLADVDVPMALDATEDSVTPDFDGHDGHDGHDSHDTATEDSIARSENQFNTAENHVPGAGPLPPSSLGQANPTVGNNTLTEFTKRRNWPARIVEEFQDFLQILDSECHVRYTSPNITNLTGYDINDVQDKFLHEFIHPDDKHVFIAEIHEAVASGSSTRLFYRFRKKSGEYTIFETVGHAHIAAAKFAPNPSNQSPFCQAIFLVSRPYPTKNAALLDSFLEHKIENERLKRRIAELRREEDTETEEAQRQWMHSQEGRSDMTPSESTGGSSTTLSRPGINPQMSEADRNALLTRENLESVAARSRPDSLQDKIVRYENSSYAERIEMLTGLRYIEGERSRGITTGNASPTLIKGDVGIAIPMDRDPRTGEKKKKLKTSEEYVCTDCGTLDSPEWRKGPNGPKTLCNACGLRWAKKEKKRNKANDNIAQQATAQPAATPDQPMA